MKTETGMWKQAQSTRGLKQNNEDRNVVGDCKVFTLLSMFSLITIELEPDIFYIKGVLNDNCDGLW